MAFLTKHAGLAQSLLRLVPACLLGVNLLYAPQCAAQGQELYKEYRVKAAYLYKFCDYVEWPAEVFDSPDSPLVIGVMGAEHMAEDLRTIVRGRTVNGRNIVVRTVYRGDNLAGMHVLFIARSEGPYLQSILDSARQQSTLTVTETEDYTPGGVINFVMSGDRVRFDVTLDSARDSRLKISSRLLSVARNVTEGAS